VKHIFEYWVLSFQKCVYMNIKQELQNIFKKLETRYREKEIYSTK